MGVLAVLGVAGVLAALVSGAAGVAASFPPKIEADAYVDASQPIRNFGTSPTLRVDSSSPVQRSFLRFDLTGVTGTVTSATLKVWATSSLSTGISAYAVADNGWSEKTITDSNAPTLGALLATSLKVQASTWVTFDVTSAVSAGGKVSFALKSGNPTALAMSSQEGANPPQLVVTTTSSQDTQAPTVPTGLTATRPDSAHVTVSWSASTDNVGVSGYNVYRDNGALPPVFVSAPATSYNDTVTANSMHVYTVDAVDAVGNHSAQSSSVSPADAAGCTTTPQSAYFATVCLTSPTAPVAPITGPFTVTATAAMTSLNGQPAPAARVRFCVDATLPVGACMTSSDGYALSDFKADAQGNFTAVLASANWVDGTYNLTARPWIGDPTGETSNAPLNPTPPVSVTFQNGVSSPPVSSGAFRPTSGTTPATGQPFVVAAVGDGASGETGETSVVNMISSWNPNLFLYLGDVYERGSPSEFYDYYGNNGYGLFSSITDPTVGNHEYNIDGQAGGYTLYWGMNATTRHYYSFDAGGWHFISLDANTIYNHQQPGSDQYQWLQADLAADTNRCTIAFWHQPLYNVGAEGPATNMQAIWSLLVSHGGVLVLNGHDHDYQRYGPLDWNGQPNANGVVEIIAGNGGHGIQTTWNQSLQPQPIKSDFNKDDFGALKLSLSAASATVEFWRTTDTTTPYDSSTFTCLPAPVQPPPAPSLTVTPSDSNDYVKNGTTVYYNPSAASGSFTVGATATGATSATFQDVFAAGDGAVVTGAQPFTHSYSWTSGASTSSSINVTASNSGGTSAANQITVTPDATAPSTSILCNFGACAGTYTSTVSVSLAASDGGSGIASTYYTTDGSDPTTSPIRNAYSAPILLTSTTTVRFSSTDHVGNVEVPQSQTITITPPSGINYVQSTNPSGTTTGTITTTLQSASLPGDTLVATIALAAGSSANVKTVTDSSGLAWSAAPVVGYLTGINSRVEIWYRLGGPSVTSVTVSLSAAKSAAVSVSEWSGVATASQPDKPMGGSGASATTISTATGFSTLDPTDLIIAATNYPAAATATLTSSGWTPLPTFLSSSVHEYAAYQITTTTGSYQTTWTLTAPSGGHGTAILALRAA